MGFGGGGGDLDKEVSYTKTRAKILLGGGEGMPLQKLFTFTMIFKFWCFYC